MYPSKRKSPAKETDDLSLETPYAVGKYSSELFVNHVFKDIPHTNVRMASLLGVGYDQRIVNRMIDKALQGETLNVVGGMQRYGFLDVRDAASALICLSLSDETKWKEIYNVGCNNCYTLIDVVNTIVSEMKIKTDFDCKYNVSEGLDERNSSLDASLFMSDISWNPSISLSETTADIIDSKYKVSSV